MTIYNEGMAKKLDSQEAAEALGMTAAGVRQAIRRVLLKATRRRPGWPWEITAAEIRRYAAKPRLGRPRSQDTRIQEE